jgi:hypothetical protein
MKKTLIIFLSLLVLVAIACSLSGGPTAQTPGSTLQANGNQPGNTPVHQPSGTPPANPVNINDGLSSLNSYQMTVIFKSSGPDPTQSSRLVVETQHSQEQDAGYTHMTLIDVKVGGGDPSTSESNIYQIGNDQCSGSGEDWSWTTMAPNQKEMLDLTKNMFGLSPLIDTPTFVAQETVNGVSTNHFTFKISGLGVTSGAEVIANQGDYWLAVDGQYIIKYILDLETSVDPQTNMLHEEISIEMNQVNQPVGIVFPQTCLDASKVTPTP